MGASPGKRFYAPGLGRWASADPLEIHAPGEADGNLYAYVSGGVLKNIDPMGLETDDANQVSFEPNMTTNEGHAADSSGNMEVPVPQVDPREGSVDSPATQDAVDGFLAPTSDASAESPTVAATGPTTSYEASAEVGDTTIATVGADVGVPTVYGSVGISEDSSDAKVEVFHAEGSVGLGGARVSGTMGATTLKLTESVTAGVQVFSGTANASVYSGSEGGRRGGGLGAAATAVQVSGAARFDNGVEVGASIGVSIGALGEVTTTPNEAGGHTVTFTAEGSFILGGRLSIPIGDF